MNILITESEAIGKDSWFVKATANTTTAWVMVQPWGLQVCCCNSSHRVWRGGGKNYRTVELALASYKSGEMKAIINLAVGTAKEKGKAVA